MNTRETQVLFLCTHNSARSQMAEALLHDRGRGSYNVVSAGTEATRVHPLAIEAMAMIGIDISRARSKTLDKFTLQEFDWVVTVCDDAEGACPAFPGPARRLHWSLPDPSASTGTHDQQLEAFITTRDDLEKRINDWLMTS